MNRARAGALGDVASRWLPMVARGRRTAVAPVPFRAIIVAAWFVTGFEAWRTVDRG